jgi:ribosome maturation factor RimP
MRTIELRNFVGKQVQITLYRAHKYRSYSGRLTVVGRLNVCLEKNFKEKWIKLPRCKRDKVEEV